MRQASFQEQMKEASFAARPLNLPQFVDCSTIWTRQVMTTAEINKGQTRPLHMLLNAWWCTGVIAIYKAKRLQSFVPFRSAIKVADVVLPAILPICLIPDYRCWHIPCICFGVLPALHRHIGCTDGKGVNCSRCTLLCSCTKMHSSYMIISCTSCTMLAWTTDFALFEKVVIKNPTQEMLMAFCCMLVTFPWHVHRWEAQGSCHQHGCHISVLGTYNQYKEDQSAGCRQKRCSLSWRFSHHAARG